MICSRSPAIAPEPGECLPARAGRHGCCLREKLWSSRAPGRYRRGPQMGCTRWRRVEGGGLERSGVAAIDDQHVADAVGQRVGAGAQLGHHAGRGGPVIHVTETRHQQEKKKKKKILLLSGHCLICSKFSCLRSELPSLLARVTRNHGNATPSLTVDAERPDLPDRGVTHISLSANISLIVRKQMAPN